MKKIKGLSKNVKKNIIGKFSTRNNILIRDRVLFCDRLPFFKFGIKALITPIGANLKTNIPVVEIEMSTPFEDLDIINITTDGHISAVWEVNSPHNAFYVTDLCNSRCVMCPQIESGVSRYNECLDILKLIKLNPKNSIGITGGEPTIEIDKLIEVLKAVAKRSPQQKVHILSNGRNFTQIENVQKLASIKNLYLSFGIPLYSDVAEVHDEIVGVKGAFEQTLQGLYNLAKFNQQIEIRTVILRRNHKGLRHLAEFILRNLPFVSHVALMGMEYHGNAETNYDIVSIDPLDYKQELFEAVREYVRYNILVDVYNIPLCLADERIREFCRDSISRWKKSYLPQCKGCSKRNICAGVFETSFVHSNNIKAIKEEYETSSSISHYTNSF